MTKMLRIYFVSLLIVTCVVVILCSPVSIVALSEERGTWLRVPAPLGQMLVTSYVHSVQKTPVQDEYVLSGGWIWQWQEKSKSHNAGLPTEPPRNGSFRNETGWFVFRGGRMKWKTLVIRVGSNRIGLNRIGFAPPWDDVSYDLFEVLPERIVYLQVYEMPFVEGVLRKSIPPW